MNILKKTKITATLGPSVTGKIFSKKDFENPENKPKIQQAIKNLSDIFDAGVNVVRFNFSHGDYEEQMIRMTLARQVAKEKGVNISLMLDTKGPEIRVHKLSEKEILINEGDEVLINCIEKEIGTKQAFSVYDPTGTYNMANDVKVGDTIFVDDGKLNLCAKSVDISSGRIIAIAKNDWMIRENKRINLPNANYSIPFMSEKDKNDIIFAAKNNFDYIAASFVNSANNVLEIRKILNENGGENVQIVSKIETMNAIEAIDEIINVSDCIMIARGDLGLEIPYYDVPKYEKYIIKSCRHKGKPVIVATQMLDSLETKIQPTRAEVTDVFFAVERGADSTMLSGETANGSYPVNAVSVMSKINISSENTFDYDRSINVYFANTPFYNTSEGKLARKIANLVAPLRVVDNSEFEYSSVIIFSNDTNLALALSNIRCASPIFLVTDRKEYATKFGLNYGVYVNVVENLNEAISKKDEIVNKINSKLPQVKETLIVIGDKILQK